MPRRSMARIRRAAVVIGAAALGLAAASAGPSAIATSGMITAPVTAAAGRAVGVTPFATTASARASRSHTRTAIASVLASPPTFSGAGAHAVPLAPFTQWVAGGALATTVTVGAATTAAAAAPVRAATQVAKLATSTAPAKPAAKAIAAWVRPSGGPLSSPFGRRWGRMHKGIDLAGSYGSSIVAATAGTVYFTGPEQGYGRIIKVEDSDGTQTWYAHMSRYLVKPGDHVKPGQRIALVGVAGDATGPNLHFEVHVGGAVVDPIPFLRKHGVRI